MEEFRYVAGALPQKEDPRDHVIRAAAPTPEKTVSHRHPAPRRNQGSEGTCVAFASASCKAWFDWRQGRPYTQYSPRDLYAQCKRLDGFPGEGTYTRVAVDILRDRGIAFEEDWPYVSLGGNEPPAGIDLASRAATQKILNYAAITSAEDAIQILLNHGPFVVCLPLTPGWYTPEFARTGFVDPQYGFKGGGHAVEILGYDVDSRRFEAGGSWGASRFDQGHHWFDREWFAQAMWGAWTFYDDAQIDAHLEVVKPDEPNTPDEPEDDRDRERRQRQRERREERRARRDERRNTEEA